VPFDQALNRISDVKISFKDVTGAKYECHSKTDLSGPNPNFLEFPGIAPRFEGRGIPLK
jgi:hypothetical protein